jgi:uncharacterized protein YoxC
VWTSADILTVLLIVAAAMLVVVLYHLIFVVVDLRKITKRVDDVTSELENVVMTPLSMVEKSMTWLMEVLMQLYADQGEKKHHKHK